MDDEKKLDTPVEEEKPVVEPAEEKPVVVDPVEEKPAPVEEEVDYDGFADEVKAPEPVVEEKPQEPQPIATRMAIDEQVPEFQDEDEEEEPVYDGVVSAELQGEPDFNYNDPHLSDIEDARQKWQKSYKGTQRIKFAYSVVIILGIIAGWILPYTFMQNAGTAPLLIGVGVAAGGIAILALCGFFLRRVEREALRIYFNEYYTALHDYTLTPLGVEGLKGDVDDKITMEEFNEGGAFDKIAGVGSRDNVVFSYKGMDCALVDASANVDGGKALRTIFVGKYLRTHNSIKNLSDDGLFIYFTGNERALPPEKMNSLHLLEKKKRYRVYGTPSDRKALTQKVREALGKIHTDKLLVDVTLIIKNGRTYWYLGYEDDIMILPISKPFDARFVREYRDQIAIILDAALTLNA